MGENYPAIDLWVDKVGEGRYQSRLAGDGGEVCRTFGLDFRQVTVTQRCVPWRPVRRRWAKPRPASRIGWPWSASSCTKRCVAARWARRLVERVKSS
jgi:hypothetical protein